MTSFSLDLAKFGQKAVNNAEKIVRKTAFDLHAKIVKRTPFKTGRAKANTQISLNTLPSDSTLEVDKSGNATIASGRKEIARFELGDTIFIYNNLEYIIPLEYGHSKLQAPNGMWRISFAEIVDELQRMGA